MQIYTSFILLIIFLNYSYARAQVKVKYCYYSKFMGYYFRLNQISFGSKFAGKTFSHQDLIAHGEYLQSLGDTVLAMLEELHCSRKQIPGLAQITDLMTMNLYLNNVLGTLLVRTLDDKEIYSDDTKNVPYKKEFEKNYRKIVNLISRSLYYYCGGQNCYWDSLVYLICKSPKTLYDSNVDPDTDDGYHYDELNDLLPDSIYLTQLTNNQNILKQQMAHLHDSTLELKHMMKTDVKRDTLSIFHPKNMLFYNMLSRDEDKNSGESDYIGLLFNVTLNEKLENGNYANIANLFEIVQRVFDVECLTTYQRQVLAATAHPVLTLVGSYILLVRHMFYKGHNKFKDVPTRAKLFEKKINELGKSIHRVLGEFIDLNILPRKVQKHLSVTHAELNHLINYTGKENIQTMLPEWLVTVFRRCSNPMVLNKLNFLDQDYFMDLGTESNCKNIVESLKTNTARIEIYVKELKNYQNDYGVVVNENKYVSYENLFLANPDYCNIVDKNKLGYSILMPQQEHNLSNRYVRLQEDFVKIKLSQSN